MAASGPPGSRRARLLREGDVPTQKMDVFPVKVSSTYLDTAIADPAQVHIGFVVTKVPSLNVTIPA